MAEHELNKIVDDDGEVFNLRDSTKQPVADRVTAWGSTPSDTKYPSEKLVKTSLDGKSNTGHTHSNIVTEGDNRNVATVPNDYSNKLVFKGIKAKAAIDNPSNDTFSYLVGLRGWANSSGGNAHELAFNNTGIFARSGSTTTWGTWQKVLTSNDLNAEARTIPQDISKGTNVIVNSNGTLQTNYNWTATTFIGDTDLPEGVAGCFHRVGGDFFCNEFISLNTSKEFTVESWYRVKTANTSTVRLTLGCFDIDKKSIQATDICYGIGTLTTVAREIKDGDTEIYLTDLSASAWDTGTNYERRLIFWDYQNSLGYTYPPETYSKHGYYKSNDGNGTWLRSSLDRENNKITLISPWDGGTVPVGTKVSRGGSGSTYYYAATSSASGAATVWTKLSGKLKGFSNNVAGGGPFRPGTAFVKIGWVNANTASPEWFEFCGIELRENPSAFNGVLPVANGGTGATTKKAAEYAINGGMAQGSGEPQDSYQFVFSRVGSDQSATNGVFLYRTAATIWSWIKGKISSVLGLSESNGVKTFTGNASTATTATTAAGYTSGGGIDTALQGKQNSITDLATIRSGASAGATAVQPGDLGTAAYKDVPTSGDASMTQVVMGGDSRLTRSVWSGGGTAVCGYKICTTSQIAGKSGQTSNIYAIVMGSMCLTNKYAAQPQGSDSSGVDGALAMGSFMIWCEGNPDGSITARARLFSSDAALNNADIAICKKYVNGAVEWFVGFGPWDSSKAVTASRSFGMSVCFDYVQNVNIPDTLEAVPSGYGYEDHYSLWKHPYLQGTQQGAGSTTRPVYITANGEVKACKQLVQAVTSIDTSNMDTDVLYVM